MGDSIERLQGSRDEKLSATLRPNSLEEFVGQERARTVIEMMMRRRGTLSDSILFIGPPGIGKTTLARLTAKGKIRTKVGIVFGEQTANFELNKLKDGDIFFIDEIHGITPRFMETLYSPMEDGIWDKGLTSKTRKDVQIVAATTEPGKLPRPLLDRFGHVIYLEPYEQSEISKILKRSQGILGLQASEEGRDDIAQRSRGIPRIGNKILRRAQDFTAETLSCRSLAGLWNLLEIDHRGLDRLDRKVLTFLASKERPTGLRVISQAVGLDADGVQLMVEPYLLKLGFIDIVPGGRLISTSGLQHLIVWQQHLKLTD